MGKKYFFFVKNYMGKIRIENQTVQLFKFIVGEKLHLTAGM